MIIVLAMVPGFVPVMIRPHRTRLRLTRPIVSAPMTDRLVVGAFALASATALSFGVPVAMANIRPVVFVVAGENAQASA